MGDHNGGLVELAADSLHQQDHIHTGFGVQIAGRFVSKDNGGLCCKGAGNRYSLLLAAGEIVWHIFEFSLQAESVDNLFYKACISLAAVDLNGVHDVFVHIENREQVVVLKDKADVSAAENS